MTVPIRRLLSPLVLLAVACTQQPPASGIVVREDATVFTLFALLNAAGYDLENHGEMHPVRVKVRAELETRVGPALRERIRSFYRAHEHDATPWSYSVVALATGGPPAFTGTSDWDDIKKDPQFGSLGELHGLMRDLYLEADVPGLYAGVQAEYVRYVADYRAAIDREVGRALAYCRLPGIADLTAAPESEGQNPVVLPNLLDSYQHAFSFELGGQFISIEGPQARLGYNPHEFIHAVTNPAVYSEATRALAARIAPLAAMAEMSSAEAFVDECLVRAVSLRYLAVEKPDRLPKLEEAMLREYRDGYVLQRFFWEQLDGFEKSTGDLRGYYPGMLERLDPEAELARWRASKAETP